VARSFRDLRVKPGSKVDLRDWSTDDTFGLDDKDEGEARLDELDDQLFELQRNLWAEDQRSLLVVLQGMDAAGKDGTIRRVFRGLNPQGVQVAGFKAPSGNERDHDYLWRIHQVCPRRGEIGIFNRSHYEDVSVVRVMELVPKAVWRRRYAHIRGFEQMLADEGTAIVKLFLHISKDEQKARFQERLDTPEKHWKFNPGDLEVRQRWDDFMDAYSEAIEETSTDDAPWFVIPGDRKWARDVAIAEILVDRLEAMNPQPPPADPAVADLVLE